MSINWYPGHMHKATKEIKEILSQVQLIIEVVDARLPYSSENPVIGRLSADKPTIKLLNKSDLADPELTQQWVEHFDSQRGVRALPVTIREPESVRGLLQEVRRMVPNRAIGGINALIMGIPNVGKSSIINILAGRTIAKTGNEPAVTKRQQRIKLAEEITLFDTPGILWPKVANPNSSYRLAASGAIKDTAFEQCDIGLFAAQYLLQAYPQALRDRFQLDAIPESDLELLEALGRQRGALVKGGLVDLNKVSKILLTELRAGNLGRITLERPEMIEAELVELEQQEAQREAEKAARKAERKQQFNKRNRR